MVLYGVGESRALIKALKDRGYGVVAVARTDYGSRLAGVSGALSVVTAPAGAGEMSSLIRSLGVRQVIDATHPFDSPVSAVAREACGALGVPYIRFGRGETDLPDDPLICRTHSWDNAAEMAAGIGGTVFLTTGSHNLAVFLQYPGLAGRRIVVRVLPEHRVIKKCQDLGVSPRDIVAIQGPFSVKLNKALFQAYRAGVIVTRDGGPSGGTENKIRAALDLGVPVVLIRREKLPGPECLCDMELLLDAVERNNKTE